MALHGLTRIMGISVLLLVICVVTTSMNHVFLDPLNLTNQLRWIAMFGILGLAAAVVIITGGIDLSIGSVVALTGILLMYLLQPVYTNSGTTFTIVGKDVDRDTVLLDRSPDGIAHLNNLVIPDPKGRREKDVRLIIDLKSDAGQLAPNEVRLLNPATRAIVGTEAQLYTHQYPMRPPMAIAMVLLAGAGIGLFHGILIGYCNLQPFIVTLCGLMGYRGLAILIADNSAMTIGFHHQEFSYLATGQPVDVPIPFIRWVSEGRTLTDSAGTQTPVDLWAWVGLPMPLVILIVVAIAGAIFLHKTVAGRYLLAMGRNAEAARFSGINTRRMTVLAYVLCSTLTAAAGILFALNLNSVQPNEHGNFYELYAIAAAVLGGCSLRGGVGSVAGVVIGTAVMRLLYNAINLLGLASYWEFIIIGGVLLLGVVIDEIGRQAVNTFKTRRRKKRMRIGDSLLDQPQPPA